MGCNTSRVYQRGQHHGTFPTIDRISLSSSAAPGLTTQTLHQIGLSEDRTEYFNSDVSVLITLLVRLWNIIYMSIVRQRGQHAGAF